MISIINDIYDENDHGEDGDAGGVFDWVCGFPLLGQSTFWLSFQQIWKITN